MKRSFPAALMIPFLGLSISAWGSQTTGLPVRPAAGQNQPAAPQSDSPGLSAPLTNADIAAMSKAKLPDSTILLTIDTALREGMAQFDTSPAALIELRQQGISEAVLNTMLLAGARLDEIARRPPDPMPALPQRYGVYYKSGQGFARRDPF